MLFHFFPLQINLIVRTDYYSVSYIFGIVTCSIRTSILKRRNQCRIRSSQKNILAIDLLRWKKVRRVYSRLNTFFFIEFNIEKSRHINKDEIKKKRERIISSIAIFVLIIPEVVKTAGHKSTKNRGVRKSLCPPPRPPWSSKSGRKKNHEISRCGNLLDRGSVVARGRQFKVTNSAIKGTLFGVLGSRVPFRKKRRKNREGKKSLTRVRQRKRDRTKFIKETLKKPATTKERGSYRWST